MLDSFMQMGLGSAIFLSAVAVGLTVVAVVMLVPYSERLKMRMEQDERARDRDRLAAIARSEPIETVPHKRAR